MKPLRANPDLLATEWTGMDTKSEFERTLSRCYRALQHILDKRTLAIPRNYDVWYTYVSGEVPALVQAIDDHLSTHGIVTQDHLDQFYERFLCPVGRLAASEEISARICGTVDQMADRLATATTKTREYREKLTDASRRFSENVEPLALEQLVQEMISSTGEMVTHTETLEASLAESRTQVMLLTGALAAMRAETLTDPLTGLANRKKFDQDLGKCMRSAVESGSELCLLMGDVDHFKKFNDMHGHQLGDEVLRRVGQILRSKTKHTDLVARYGGEEFAIILPKTNLQRAVAIANRIQSALLAAKIAHRIEGPRLDPITMSFGAARHNPNDTVESFVERADTSLYAAKKAGRNCVRTETEIVPVRGPAVA